MWDAIVVGAGIAGASAALFLRQAGLRVLVLEREALPHAKTCAGGVPYSVLRQFPFAPDEVVEREITAVRFVRGVDQVTHPLERQTVATVCRERLDSRVLQASGAEVRDCWVLAEVVEGNDCVIVRSASGEAQQARWLLAADGCSSRVARLLDLAAGRRLAPAIEARIPLCPMPPQLAGLAEFDFGLPYGYTWVFPKRDHVSVGAVAFRRGRADLKGHLAKALTARGWELGRSELYGHPLPLYRPGARLHGARTLLLGDAAGLVDPLLGEGVRHAVHSARLAAQVLAAGAPLPEYTRRVHREIGRSLRRSGQLAAFVYRWPGLAFQLILSNPTFADEMSGVFAGQQDMVALSHRLPGIAIDSLLRAFRARTSQEAQ